MVIFSFGLFTQKSYVDASAWYLDSCAIAAENSGNDTRGNERLCGYYLYFQL